MKKASLRMLLGLVLALGMSAAAFAEEGGEANGKRRRRGGQQDGQRNGQRHRPGRRMRHRLMIMHRLRNTEEGKAEIERFRKAMKAHHEEGKKLHETIRKEIEEGGKPKEVFEAHAAELKALMKKGILLRIEHRENMLTIAKKYVDKFVDEMFKKMQERGKRRMQRPDEDGENDEDAEGDEDRRRRRPPRRRRRPDNDDDNDNEDGGPEDGPFDDEE